MSEREPTATPRSAPLRALLVCLLLPSLAAIVLGLPGPPVRPPVNVDYLLLAAAIGWLRRPVWIALFAALLCADALRVSADLLYFQPGTFIASVPYLPSLDRAFAVGTVVALIGMIALAAGGFAALLGRAERSRALTRAFLGGAVTIVIVDAATTGNALFRRDTALLGLNLSTSSVWTTARSVRREIAAISHEGWIVKDSAPAATDVLRGLPPHRLPSRVLLVLSESWGHPADPALNALVLAPTQRPELAVNYFVKHGTVPVTGATVSGEFRELCGVRVSAVSPRPEQVPSARCLPHQLRALGYETISVHGFSGGFFARSSWYPALGFDRSYFARELERAAPGLPVCGSVFRGQCDDAVFDWLARQMPQGRRQFVYWLTLTAHGPLGAQSDALPCPESSRERLATACRVLALNRAVLESVVAWALTDAARDTLIIVAGDHPPRLLDPAARAVFDQTQVPYVTFWPRDAS